MSLLDQLGKIVPSASALTPNYIVPTVQEVPAPQDDHTYLTSLEQSKAAESQKLSELYLELGKSYYESHSEDHPPEYAETIAAIVGSQAEITRFQQQLDEIAARRRCPSCGSKLMEGSKFCNICGAKLPDGPSNVEAPEQEQRLCPQCKAVLAPEDDFCTSCGADLRK